MCSELRRDVGAGRHSLNTFAKEVQSICEAAVVRLFPANKFAASRVLAGLDTANRMLMAWGVADGPQQQPQYAPTDDRGLWLPEAESRRYLQPAPQQSQWEPPQPPLPSWLQDVAAGHAAAYQLLQQQQQQHEQQQYYEQQQQYAAQFAAQPQGPALQGDLPADLQQPQTMSMQEFLQLPHQEQRYQQLLQQRQQAAAAANWESVMAADRPDPTRRAARQTGARRQLPAPSSGGKRKEPSDGGAAPAKLANGSARANGGAKAPKKSKVRACQTRPALAFYWFACWSGGPCRRSERQTGAKILLQVESQEQHPALSQEQRDYLADLLIALASAPSQVCVERHFREACNHLHCNNAEDDVVLIHQLKAHF